MDIKSASFQRTFHLWALYVWGTAGAYATWELKGSVAWVNFMSLYAIVISHWAAYAGFRAEMS